MSLPQTLGPSSRPVDVSVGGTGASTAEGARRELGVPSLSGNNQFDGMNSFRDTVDVVDVTVNDGVYLGPLAPVVFNDTNTLDEAAGATSRAWVLPDASGTVVVTPDTPATGDILYFNGSAWKKLSAPADALAHTLTITSGALSWV